MRKPTFSDLVIALGGIVLVGHTWTMLAADKLTDAAIRNDTDAAKAALTLAPWAVNCTNMDHRLFAAMAEYPIQPPLLWACQENSSEIIALYLEHGANVNAVSYSSKLNAVTATLCYHQLTDERFEIVQLLLDHGFDLTTPQAKDGNDVLSASVRIYSNDTQETKEASFALFLRTKEAFEAEAIPIRGRVYECGTRSILTLAAMHCNQPVVEHLLTERYYRINERDAIGQTALTAVLYNGGYSPEEYDFCEYLLSEGADPAITDNFGRSAMDYAETSGDAQLLELLDAWAQEDGTGERGIKSDTQTAS